MRSVTLLRAPLAAAVLATVACLPSPAAAAVRWEGLSCGLLASRDPTGVVHQDPNLYSGVMTLGPVDALNPLDPLGTGVEVEIHCWVQVNNDSYSHFSGPASAHCHARGVGGAAGSCAVEFAASLVDNVYVCTLIHFVHAGGFETYRYDADPPGLPDCALALQAGDTLVAGPAVIPPPSA